MFEGDKTFKELRSGKDMNRTVVLRKFMITLLPVNSRNFISPYNNSYKE